MGGLSGQGARSLSAGRTERIRRSLPLAAFRRHAAASLALPGAHPRSHPAHARRAFCRARHVHTRGVVARAARPFAFPPNPPPPPPPPPPRGGLPRPPPRPD